MASGGSGATTRHVRLAGVDVELTRKRVRNINLRVRQDATVCVSAAPRVPLRAIEELVASRKAWIEDARRRIGEQARRSEVRCVEGAQVSVWGTVRTCRVTVAKDLPPRQSCSFSLAGPVLVAAVDQRLAGDDEASTTKRSDALGRFLRKEAQDAVRELLPAAEELVGRRATAVRYRLMKTRWGSCNVRTGIVTINTRLVHYDRRCLAYVLVHELCHLHEPSHNKRFQALMDSFMPEWRAVRAQLNGL